METKENYKVQVEIKETGLELAVVDAPFGDALEALTKNGYEIISLPQISWLRIGGRYPSNLLMKGTYVREGILYIPGKKPKLVRNSPILESAKEATQAHRNIKEFYPTKEQVERALTDSIDFPQKAFEIPTNRFASEAFAVYAFGGKDEARAYGEFLGKYGIKKFPVYSDVESSSCNPYVRQTWLRGFNGGGDLGDLGRVLHFGSILYGVKMTKTPKPRKKLPG